MRTSKTEGGIELSKSYIRLSVMTAVVLLLFSLFTSTGCRKKEKPKGVFDRANEVIAQIDSTTKDISREIANLASSLRAGTQLTIALVEEIYDRLKEQTENIISDVKDAREEIDKITKSENLPEYRKYAQIQEEILDNAVAITNTLSALFDQLSAASETLKTGKAADTSSIAKTAEDLVSELNRLRAQGERLREKAKKFKQEKGL